MPSGGIGKVSGGKGKMYVSKFLTFGLSAVLELAGGVGYAFSLYSPALKESLGYTQMQIQGLANPLVPSLIVGLIPGFAYDLLQQYNRFGPRFALLLGGVIHAVGYTGLWAVGTHRIPHAPYWLVLTLSVIGMNGASWTDVACISANVRNFPHDRGTAIGILKAMMGLSASVYTTIYAVTVRPDALSFILFIAAAMLVPVLISFPVFNAVPFRQTNELSQPDHFWSNGVRFAIAYTVVGVLGLFMLVATKLDDSIVLTPEVRVLMLSGIAACLSPLLLLWLGSSGVWARPAVEALQPSHDEECTSPFSPQLAEPLLPRAASSPAALEPAACDAAGHAALSGPLQPDGKAVWPLEFTAAESLVQVNFWLLATIFGVGSSCAILFLNNAGQLVESLKGEPDGQDPLLTLFSVASCFGRLVFGFLPEQALHMWGTPRTAFLVGVSVCMMAVTLLTALAEDVSLLWLTAPLSGLAYGGHWSLMPALASELFGLSHFGLNYCLIGNSITIISFLVSNMLGGYVYETRLIQHGDKGNICIGADCFRATFLLAGCLEVVAVAAAVALMQRTRSVFTGEYQEIVQEEEAVKRSPATGHRLIPQRVVNAAAAAQRASLEQT